MRVLKLAELFGYTNVFVAMGFALAYDVIEKPNAIAYAALVLSVLAAAGHHVVHRGDFKDSAFFGFMCCICLIAIGHNINYLWAVDYKGHTEVVDARYAGGEREYWKVQLGNGRNVGLMVYRDPSDAAASLRLRRGVFGVYFGEWRRAD